MAKEQEAKSKDNERYARSISTASNPSSKASYQKMKIDAAARHDRRIEQLKKQIAFHFNHYKDLKKAGTTEVKGIDGYDEAIATIKEAQERWTNK